MLESYLEHEKNSKPFLDWEYSTFQPLNNYRIVCLLVLLDQRWCDGQPDPGDGGEWVHQVRGPQERCPGTVHLADNYTKEKEQLERSSKVPDPGDGGEWVHQVRGPQERCPGTVLTAEIYQREGIAREEQ